MLNWTKRRAYCFFLTLVCGTSVSAQTLTIAWRDKPPHQYVENGVEKGILFDLAKRVFLEANIPARFTEEPAKRIWNNFANATHNYCSFGWYKIPERENLVQFSTVFYRDLPHTLVVGPAAIAQVKSHKDLKTLLDDDQLRLAIVDGVSYGVALDAMLKTAKNKIIRSSASPMVMARMIKANRASYMLIDREDWDYLKSKDSRLEGNIQIDMPDMPAGIDRYIVCSRGVSIERMQSINKALEKIKAAPVKAHLR